MKTKPALLKRAGKAFKKATPTILTCISAAGVVVTVVLAVKATPKALKCIEKEKAVKNAENSENLTRMETIAACWRCYIPAAVTGIATIGCIFGANTLNRRQQASLVSAYALASRSFNSYKQKVKELYGEEAHKKVMASLAAEKSTKPTISAGSLTQMTSVGFEDRRAWADCGTNDQPQAHGDRGADEVPSGGVQLPAVRQSYFVRPVDGIHQ